MWSAEALSGSEQRVGSSWDSYHHQQHVLRDSETCRPSLILFAEVPPAASTTGMRLPARTKMEFRSTDISTRFFKNIL